MRSVLRSKFVITYIKSCFRELSFLMIIIILLEIIRHEDSRHKASRNNNYSNGIFCPKKCAAHTEGTYFPGQKQLELLQVKILCKW